MSAISTCHAQKTILFNPRLDHFLLNKGSNISSSYAKDSLFSSINYKNRLGVLSDIKDIYFDITTAINNAHTIGAKVYSEQETSLFTKSKIEAVYALTIPIHKNIKWALGSQFGAANIKFGGTDASAGGSDWAFDIAISNTIQYKKIDWGIALMQIPNATLQPIGYNFILERYIDSYISTSFDLNPYLIVETGIEYKKGINLELWSIDNKITYKDQYGLLLRLGDYNSFSAGLFMEVPYVMENLYVSGSYSNYFRQENLRFNSFSLSIYYQYKG